jgi:sarcosine oxidase
VQAFEPLRRKKTGLSNSRIKLKERKNSAHAQPISKPDRSALRDSAPSRPLPTLLVDGIGIIHREFFASFFSSFHLLPCKLCALRVLRGKSENQRTKSEPKANRNRTETEPPSQPIAVQTSKVARNRTKSGSKPNQTRTDSEPSAQKHAQPIATAPTRAAKKLPRLSHHDQTKNPAAISTFLPFGLALRRPQTLRSSFPSFPSVLFSRVLRFSRFQSLDHFHCYTLLRNARRVTASFLLCCQVRRYSSTRMPMEFDAIVIGAGMAGSAAAWQLSKDGRRVLLLEQFEIGHARGSSHGESRIFRFAYPQPEYAKFAMQSKPLWLELERDSGKQLLHTIGGLDFADDPDCFGEVKQIAAALRQNGAACEELDAKKIRRRFPQWRIPDSTIGVFSPDGGWIEATHAVRAMVEQTAKRGGVIRDRESVSKIRVNENEVAVATSEGEYRAGSLVIAAGAWVHDLLGRCTFQFQHLKADPDSQMENLLRFLKLPLKVTQEQPVYFAPIRNAESFRAGRFPIWIHYRKPHFAYGFPMLDTPGVKVAFHHDGPVIDPARADRTPNPEVSRRLKEYLKQYLPDAAGEIVEEVTCLYTTTPDHNFVIDLLPGIPNVAIASACSGHGFKFAAGIGRALADLVQFGKTDMEISLNCFFSTVTG